jgi:hypothetical protein
MVKKNMRIFGYEDAFFFLLGVSIGILILILLKFMGF